MTFERVPPRYITEGFTISSKGAVRAMFSIMHVPAKVMEDASETDRGRLSFSMRW